MGASDDLKKEFEAIKEQRDLIVKNAANILYGDLVFESPEDTGELKASWQLPQEIIGGWQIRNIAPHAVVIDGGRRVDPDGKTRGSERLIHGFQPTVKKAEQKLNQALKAIK